uniref:KfrB domain-containing protein n=1 Tax=Curvibacter symbiont subsp. Hydra magnipapillata TaxID=667019 RepID=C9YBG7_CURXX|nr:hypothetical protein Csp_A14680 [Curvibacter putative symbiont of Hydra magnipapillata]
MLVMTEPSLDDMVAWVTASQGELEEVLAERQYCGPVLKMSEHHALQKIGRRNYTIHKLDELNSIPELNHPKTTIRYRDGRGSILDDDSLHGGGVAHVRDILSHALKKFPAR